MMTAVAFRPKSTDAAIISSFSIATADPQSRTFSRSPDVLFDAAAVDYLDRGSTDKLELGFDEGETCWLRRRTATP